MEKDLSDVELFEIYGGLLTDKQKALFSDYYLLDLSLSEIAESQGTSRQSVYDGIKKAKNQLYKIESVLGLKNIREKLIEISDKLSDKNIDLTEIKKSVDELIGNQGK